MLTRAEFDRLPKNTVPEILRSNLTSHLLQLLSIGYEDVERFDFLEKPPKDAIEGAMRSLRLLGAVKGIGNEAVLTALGKKMSSFPLEPSFTKAILCAKQLGCT
jgi:HrpA-like RNA helicase